LQPHLIATNRPRALGPRSGLATSRSTDLETRPTSSVVPRNRIKGEEFHQNHHRAAHLANNLRTMSRPECLRQAVVVAGETCVRPPNTPAENCGGSGRRSLLETRTERPNSKGNQFIPRSAYSALGVACPWPAARFRWTHNLGQRYQGGAEHYAHCQRAQVGSSRCSRTPTRSRRLEPSVSDRRAHDGMFGDR
jgi:hypothetical protein